MDCKELPFNFYYCASQVNMKRGNAVPQQHTHLPL